MPKILSKAGDSLADTYDVQGSIAGIDTLETRELPIVHEMGGTVFSERLTAQIRRGAVAGILQNAAFDILMTDFPAGATRLLGVTVLASNGGRVNHCQVSMVDPVSEREIPFFVWDSATDVSSLIRIVDNGAAVATVGILIGNPVTVPNLGVGTGQPRGVGQDVVCRGFANAFGAGTLDVTVLLHQAFGEIGGISSRGLPVPSW